MADSDTTAAPQPAGRPADKPVPVVAPVAELQTLEPSVLDDAIFEPVAAAVSSEAVDLEPVKRAMLELSPKVSDTGASPAPIAAPVEKKKRVAVAEPLPDSRIGVLLVNLGTPDAPDAKSVRRYLKEFLSDPRVIENDSLIWRLVFNWIILPLRPRSRARAYRKIWNKEQNESPLKTITRAQSEKLAAMVGGFQQNIVVDWAMRYGSPSIPSRLEAMLAGGCERLLLLPLYPQYSAATTATVCDVVFRTLMSVRRQPTLRVGAPYYNDRTYIDSLASSIQSHLRSLDVQPEVIVASYHGMPQDYVKRGDPYEQHCIETTRLLRERLGMDETKLLMTFQSRFGRAKWLQPYTDKTIKKLAKDGVKSIAVVTPGFSADCLETLEEIAIENAAIFKRYGGEKYVVVPCLNDGEPGMQVLWQMMLRELKGWA